MRNAAVGEAHDDNGTQVEHEVEEERVRHFHPAIGEELRADVGEGDRWPPLVEHDERLDPLDEELRGDEHEGDEPEGREHERRAAVRVDVTRLQRRADRVEPATTAGSNHHGRRRMFPAARPVTSPRGTSGPSHGDFPPSGKGKLCCTFLYFLGLVRQIQLIIAGVQMVQ